MDLSQARFNMIEQQIRPWDVLHPRVLEVMEQTPREDFVSQAYRKLAYADLEIPLGSGEYMMSPKLEARLLQALDPQPTEVALEIGTGSGYLTACLAKLCAHVDSVERIDEFRQHAVRVLKNTGLENYTLRAGNAAQGFTQIRTRYDIIAVTGSVPQYQPSFEAQLGLGGRLFIVVGEGNLMHAMLITRLSEHEFSRINLFETSLPPLYGVEKRPAFVF